LFVDVHLLLSRKKTIELPNNQLEKADDRRGQIFKLNCLPAMARSFHWLTSSHRRCGPTTR